MILVPDLPDIERTAQSDAERRFARLLSEIPRNDGVAFYSVKLRSHAYKQMAEADFIILWKGVVIVVEVKGGGIKKHQGIWYSIDRHGDAHRLATSPMEQARSAMFALKKILREDGTGWFASEAVTVTPDIESPPPSTEWLSSHWLARDEMTISALSSALDVVAGGAPSQPVRQRIASADELRTRFFGEFSRMPVIDVQRGAVIDEQNRATEGQARVLAGLAGNPRMVVLGGAGTGKSLVLAEAAKQEAASGRSVLITFKSPGLRRFFEPRVTGRDIDIVPFDDLTEARRYDALFVDEAQDLMYPEAMDILDLVILGGRETGRWRMFVDQNNQAHVDGIFDSDVFDIIRDEAVSYELNLNVRNTRAIVHAVQEYLGADVGDPGIVNGERIQWRWGGNNDTLEDALALARDLKVEGVRAENIWIIPVNAEVGLDESHDDVRVLSPRMSKGLEAEYVIVCGLPDEFDDLRTANFYVALTRARVSLHVVANEDDKKRLQALAKKQAHC